MQPSTVFWFFVLLVAAAMALTFFAHRRRVARAAFLDAYAFPEGIRGRVHKRYPHLDDTQLDQVFAALREYFHLCRKAGRRRLAMPSQAVDVAWHEFILSTRHYEQFCRRALGRFLHHTPSEAMRSPTEATDGIRRAWRMACRREGIDPAAPAALPLLFAIDTRLAIPDGFRYALNCMAVAGAASAGTFAATYCASHIGCGGAGCGGGCHGDGCSGGDGGGCGGGGD